MSTRSIQRLYWVSISLVLTAFALQGVVSDLPKTFSWGVATTAYQIEGAWNTDGKGPSIWDDFTQHPGRIANNDNGTVADDFYHLWEKDVQTMIDLGLKNTEMSISWSRLLPDGTTDNVNQLAVDYYNKVLNTLIVNGIDPWITIYHWDLPLALNDKTSTGGWLNPNIVNLYNDYADFLFNTFGDRVKHWITFNEIMEFSWSGYGQGVFAPGRCSPDQGAWCQEIGGGGNSSTEPYIVTHNALLAHATAVQTYRTKYQEAQKGYIGMTIDCVYALPFNPNSEEDRNATNNYMAFNYGWIADPLVFGKYPDVMYEYITGDRLPKFTDAESALLKGSYDFLGLDYYTSRFVRHTGIPGSTYGNDSRISDSPHDVFNNQIGPQADNDWLYVYAPGMRGMLRWISNRYGNPPIFVFENGVAVPGESKLAPADAVHDSFRTDYLTTHIDNVIAARDVDKIDVRGYFVWSLLDNFEWTDGFSVRFGIVYVDYANNLTRTPKDSFNYYKTRINTTQAIEVTEAKNEEKNAENDKFLLAY